MEGIHPGRVMAHPAYHLGWGRLSCMSCIFGDEDQWASLREINPGLFEKILAYERDYGKTIKIAPPPGGQAQDVEAWADAGRSFVPDDAELIELAMSEDYPPELVIVPEGQPWPLPIGAYKQAGGPS